MSLVELSHRRHSRDALAAKLRQLLSLARIHVDEAIHVANAEPLYAILWLQLPLRTKSVGTHSSALALSSKSLLVKSSTHIVTQRPVWLLCGTTVAGFISSSSNCCPTFQLPEPLKS